MNNANNAVTTSNSTALVTKDYQGTPFVFREDGYFNMTKAASHFKRRMDHFLKTQETKDYLAAMKPYAPKSGDKKLMEVQRGSGMYDHVGTWGHPKLAVFFARWLDVRFAVWCDAVIDDILHKRAELVITKPAESAVMALPSSFSAALRALADAEEARERQALARPLQARGEAFRCHLRAA